ncbi:hypothetical protein [Mesorhizobium mediterraneum]|uniref:hypothetical protein n=1 Tax=Mesorhizobium mediterraneum TaxID=43617 RepID=UPI001780A339|nr:hypothetical protein [Mesorhizobium mediterraneum]
MQMMELYEKANEINVPGTPPGFTKTFQGQYLMANFALKWANRASLSLQRTV